jgi:hypothetical protein
MPLSSPKFSIPQKVADIAIEYSVLAKDKRPNVSHGIKRMQQRIEELEKLL